MTLTEKLNVLIEEKGINRKQLSEQSGIPYMTIVNFYEKGTENVKLSTLKKLAAYFNVSLDYIADDSIIEKSPATAKVGAEDLDRHEREMLDNYRNLLPEFQKVANKSLKTLFELQASIIRQDIECEPASNIIPIRMSEQSASAGTGTYLGPEAFHTVYVLDNDMTDHTAFAVPVSGNSMEPRYHDGDILLIADETMEIGDIGLFTLDGCGYVKKLGYGELISLNPDYKSIPLNDSIKCNGKVIATLNKNWLVEK